MKIERSIVLESREVYNFNYLNKLVIENNGLAKEIVVIFWRQINYAIDHKFHKSYYVCDHC